MTVTTVSSYHVPVLLKESVDGLNIREGGVYVDVTFGGGGHSREILSRLGGSGHLYSFDQDADAAQRIAVPGADGAGTAFRDADNFTFVLSNFRFLKNWMRYYGVDHIDGLLADLGVSSHQFDVGERGFSFRFDAPLDMRMNNSAGKTAADVLNEYDEERLADVFYLYGELKQARRLAKAVVEYRRQKAIATTADLSELVEPMMRSEREKKDLARVYQALRIEVNHEMDALAQMLTAATSLLRPGGRLSVITYHSLEDRMVKNIIRSGRIDGRQQQDFFGRTSCALRPVGKPIVPTEAELQQNPRSRSAKLRIAEKTDN